VTVLAGDSDPYILQFQRYAVVSRLTAEGYYVTLDATVPPGGEFGPFPPAKLQRGWRDNSGRWRAP
jgi:hypothetical protein